MNHYSPTIPPRFASLTVSFGCTLLRLAVGFALGSLTLRAQTTTWNNQAGVTTADFNNASNWSNGAPNSSTQAVFSGASAVAPFVTADIAVSGLLFSSDASGYTIPGTGKLTLMSTGTGTSSALVYQPTANTNAQVNGSVILGAAAGSTQTFTSTTSTGNLFVYGNISSTNTVNLNIVTASSSAGAVNLMATGNTYSGNTSVTGLLKVTSLANSGVASSIGTGSKISLGSSTTNGTLSYTGTSASAVSSNRTIDLAGTSATGVLASNGTGPIVWTGNVVASGAGSKSFTLDGANTGANEFSGIISDNSAINRTFVRKQNTGTWTLSGLNTYTGATTVNGGILNVTTFVNGGIASSIGASSNAAGNVILATGGPNAGTLRYVGAATSSDRLFTLSSSASLDASGTGALNLTNTGNLAITGSVARTLTLAGSNTGANTLSAAITEPSASFQTSLTKTGTGTWKLAGTSTYTGMTTVSAGNLTLLGALGNTAISVASGATFAGTGTATGSLLLSNGGKIAPGDGGLGILTVGAFTWTGGGGLEFDLGTGNSSDKLAVTGAFGASGTGFNFDFLSGGTSGSTYTLLTFGSNTSSLTASDFSYTHLASGLTGVFTMNATSLSFSIAPSAIPEPSTYAAIFGGLALTGALWHRGRKNRANATRVVVATE